jgi:LuxR family maltose regulon positive regulatory protein
LERLPGIPSLMDLPEVGSLWQPYLTPLINKLTRLQTPAVLILDDLHLVESANIYEGLSFFLDHLPSTLTLVISTRADPPLPLARLRARGKLVEFRQANLRFTHQQITDFLREVMGLDLTPGDITALEKRTEGWIAGLQMAALSMQQRDDLNSFVQEFSGSHRYVMDYLLEEVLSRQSPAVQRFLLRTSILERLCAPLCAALSPMETTEEGSRSPAQLELASQGLLEELEGANLFIHPLDDHRTWYRYHRLFADLLRRQLQQLHPELVTDLHRQASTWFEHQGYLAESIEHSLAGGLYSRAVALIEKVSESYLMRSEVITLGKWLNALPEEVLSRSCELTAHNVWLLLLAGASISRMKAIIAAVDEEQKRTSGHILAVEGLLALFQGRLDQSWRLVETALVNFEESDGFWVHIARWLQMVVKLSESSVDEDELTQLDQYAYSHLSKGNILLGVMGVCNIAELRVKQGRLRDAEDTLEKALALVTDDREHRLPITGEILVWLGEVARERNQLERAEKFLSQGIQLLGDWGRVTAIEGYLFLAQVFQAKGDRERTRQALGKAEKLAVMFDATEMDDHLVAMSRVRCAAMAGDFKEVERWIKSRGLDKINSEDLAIDATVELHLRKYELTTLGFVRIHQERPGEALAFLEPLLPEIAARGRWRLGIEILAQQAIAYHLLGETKRALNCLEEALRRAEPEGYMRLFLDFGEHLAPLLNKALKWELFPAYIGELLMALPPVQVGQPLQKPSRLIEPLSEREMEVISAIAEGLSNQEIAQHLFISERTVKWHASNIYGKLQASNRTEAVAKARSFGLLPS